MARRYSISLIVLSVILVSISCSRAPFSLIALHTELSLTRHYDREGRVSVEYESLALFLESEVGNTLHMEVLAPDTLTSWSFPATPQMVKEHQYYGRGGLTLGSGTSLPRGEWEVKILHSDGRTITEHFTLEQTAQPLYSSDNYTIVDDTLILGEGITDYSLEFLDAYENVLYTSFGTEQEVELSSLYPIWQQAHYLLLCWYDEPAQMSIYERYEL